MPSLRSFDDLDGKERGQKKTDDLRAMTTLGLRTLVSINMLVIWHFLLHASDCYGRMRPVLSFLFTLTNRLVFKKKYCLTLKSYHVVMFLVYDGTCGMFLWAAFANSAVIPLKCIRRAST